MSEIDLSEVGRRLFEVVIAQALMGRFFAGLTWVVQSPVSDRGPATVRFAVDGDLVGAIHLLELAPAVQRDIAQRASFQVQGRVTLQLEESELEQLRGMLRPGADQPVDELLAAYAQGLDLTAASLADLLQRAVKLNASTKEDLRSDLVAAGFPTEHHGQVLSVLDQSLAELARRFSERQGRLRELRDELLRLGPDDREAGLERVLAEEYGLLAECEADLAAFESALQNTRRAAAARFGG